MAALFDELLELLELEAIEENLFRGASHDLGFRQLFGGQVIGQALAAATRTVEGRPAHSLHGYFLRPGDVQLPVVYQVERLRDGGSFSARRVTALQKGRTIFTLSASFQDLERGLEHQVQAPPAPDPESLGDDRERLEPLCKELPAAIRQRLLRQFPVEFRSLQLQNPLKPVATEPARQIWLRFRGKVPAGSQLHRYLLAYASDYNLLLTALLPHGVSFRQPFMQVASLDHALWFHREPDLDDWLLYSMDSPWAGAGRGLARGCFFDRHGQLVASVAQEGLIRRHEAPL